MMQDVISNNCKLATLLVQHQTLPFLFCKTYDRTKFFAKSVQKNFRKRMNT